MIPMIFFGLGGIFAILALWTLAGALVLNNVERLAYTVESVKDGYEIRTYAPHIVAEVSVATTDERLALRTGFRLVADYIFGNNITNAQVAMTTPVVLQPSASAKIAMTAPVLASENSSDTRAVAFVMPAKYTSIAALPVPNNPAVRLRVVPGYRAAARRFSWFVTNARIAQEKQWLLEDLKEDGIAIVGTIAYAGYNPPFTIPFMRQHEVLATIASPRE